MAYWLSCLFLACCSSLLTAPVVGRSLSFPETFDGPSGALALRKDVGSRDGLRGGETGTLLNWEVANEPDPDSAESGFLLPGNIWAVASETVLHDEASHLEFVEWQEEPMLSFVSDTESTNLGLVLDDDESSISSVLNQNGLPIGLLPSCVKTYTLSDAGQFSVSLEEACYVNFDYEVYYAPTITGTLSYGTISDLSGIQAKKAFIWLPVTGIHIDASSSSYIYFDVGPISKRLSITQFQTIPSCKANAMDFSALA